MSEGLTEKQRDVYNFICEYVAQNSFPPSVREIAAGVGVSSPATIQGHINALVQKGLLERSSGRSRTLSVVEAPDSPALITDPSTSVGEIIAVPLVGRVAAGSPILAEENIEETLVLPASYVHGETFMLRVHGDSMINVGIFDGDLVIVRKSETAQNGDIVVALIEDGATVKTFYREAQRVRLQPENDTMEPFYPEDVRIAGVVVGLMRFGL